ncbi:cell division protein FtsQ/DivIB [Georgenia wangjunii]|uniref:cell division protein FtsQ/DivIB n=1 Tax=Georgenia wangjunii TaxID=3117730 RepID=UPI002F2696D0
MRPPPQPRRPARDAPPPALAARDGGRPAEPAQAEPGHDEPGEHAPMRPAQPAWTAARSARGRAAVDMPSTGADDAPGSAVALATLTRPAVATGLAERQAERESARRRLVLRRLLLTLAVVAALAAIGWALLVSPLLALDPEQVSVAGTGTTVAAEDVLAVVEPQVGVPLPRVDVTGVRAGLEDLTTVRTAEVTRAWPRGLEVVVEPREPVAAAASPDGFTLLDRDGVSIGAAADAPAGLPLVTVPLDSPDTAASLAAVLTVLAGLSPEQLAEVATAGAPTPRSVTLVLADGAEVRWGSADETELKAAVLEVLRGQPARVYDLTVPRSPTTVS